MGKVVEGSEGFGYTVSVTLDPEKALLKRGKGSFGWAGAASTFFWVDPKEQLTGVIMTQFIGSGVPLIEDLQNAVYQELKKS